MEMNLAILALVATLFSFGAVQARPNPTPMKCKQCESYTSLSDCDAGATLKECDADANETLCFLVLQFKTGKTIFARGCTDEEAYKVAMQMCMSIRGCKLSSCTEPGCMATIDKGVSRKPMECPTCLSLKENPQQDCDSRVQLITCGVQGAKCMAYEQTAAYVPYFQRGCTCVDEETLQSLLDDCKQDGELQGICRLATCNESGCMAEFDQENSKKD